MRIGLITPDPGHPLLATAAELLGGDHEVRVLDPADPGAAACAAADRADVYLLKARTPRALELARELERQGARVVNSADATERCQDRTEMAELARRAGLPFATTRTFGSLGQLALHSTGPGLPGMPWPVVVKSRRSRKGDLVARVDDAARLRKLAGGWGQEPVVVQAFAPNNGWDHKLWAIGNRVFTALRRSELADEESAAGHAPDEPLPELAELTLRVGEVFGLDVYGVDVIDTGEGAPLIVDVNAFPGIRGQAGAPEALAALAVRRARGNG
ncbi:MULTISPECIES: ATP-grasp domain-containing protein [unclassified Streptomyces]|uniref:ATP-grasp domain-containing protein n=1 Tax=unclassified Streptomyces TaxID=2593676 RepID=UPI00226F05AF|nr:MULTISPECIES: alpha-L-glutamate ligase [unclassified Streptomyces]MCY0957801.1 alpha-L-glutamate ligase [Streptomyces sp. H27-H5]